MIKGLEHGQRAALLISECQNGITNSGYTDTPLAREVSRRGIVQLINKLAEVFRRKGLPVIHCTIAAPADFDGWVVNCVLAAQIRKQGKLVTGSRFAAVHDDLPLQPGDIVLERQHGMAPFSGTNLDAMLRSRNINTVVLAGVSTNVALPGAATEAIARFYNVVLAEDCSAGGTAETHEMQVTKHFPLLATVTDSFSIAKALET